MGFFIKNVFLPGLLGGALAGVGYPFTTWQFWLVFVLALLWRVWPESEGRG